MDKTIYFWILAPLEKLTCLAEEVGEVARELNHMYGTKKKRPEEAKKQLGDELVDVLFTIVCIANDEGINLNQAWDERMQEKLYGRDKNRFKKKININQQ